MNRMIYLVGPPGSGKSQLMAKLTKGMVRKFQPACGPECPVSHDRLYDGLSGELIGAEIGVRRELFSGTDALPSSVIEKAVPWVETVPYPLLLAEGARLGNRRFIVSASASYHVTLALLDHADQEAWRRKRSKAIGRIQNDAWVKGRLTASRNLAEQVDGRVLIDVLRGHPDELYEPLMEIISTSG